MTKTVIEITNAIENLQPNELSELSEWFEKFEEEIWDKKIAKDLENGKLQKFIDEAEKDFEDRKCQPI